MSCSALEIAALSGIRTGFVGEALEDTYDAAMQEQGSLTTLAVMIWLGVFPPFPV